MLTLPLPKVASAITVTALITSSMMASAAPLSAALLSAAPVSAVSTSPSEDRDVQIRSVDFDLQIVELHNFGCADIDLTGWRFCTHDSNDVRVYSAPAGLGGLIVEPSTSVFIHFLNNAPVNDPDRVNQNSVGAFALPLDTDAYGMQIYSVNASGFVSFGDSSLIADHVQWNTNGSPVGQSTFRSGQATTTGLWSGTLDFVTTELMTSRIELNDLSNGRLHGPSDYDAVQCATDIGFGNPAAARLSMCGGFATGETSQLVIDGTPPNAPAVLFVGLTSNPQPVFGGMLVTVPDLFSAVLATDATGRVEVSIPGGGGLTFFLQSIYLDASMPFSLGFTNAIRAELQP